MSENDADYSYDHEDGYDTEYAENYRYDENGVFSKDEWNIFELTIRYTSGTILITGMITSILILIVLVRRSIGSSTTRIILIFLALADFGTVVARFFNAFLPDHQFTRIYTTDFACVITQLSSLVAQNSSSWYLVLLTAERFMVVWFPLKVRKFSTKKVILTTCILIPITQAACMGPLANMFVHLINAKIGSSRCTLHANVDIATFQALLNFRNAIYLFIPMVIMFTLNIGIAVSLHKAHERHRNLTMRVQPQHCNSQNNLRKATTLVVVASIAFMVLNAPRVIVMIAFGDWTYQSDESEITDRVVGLLQYLNHSINFFLYVLANRKFRQELKNMCLCGRQATRVPSESGRVKSVSSTTTNKSGGSGTISTQTSMLSMVSGKREACQENSVSLSQ